MAVRKINIDDSEISVIFGLHDEDYICLTDMVKAGDNSDRTNIVIQNWMRRKDTISYLGVWETLHNPNFKSIEFDAIKNASGTNRFILTAKEWIERTNAIGIIAKSGRYGGTYAHKDIAYHLGSANWITDYTGAPIQYIHYAPYGELIDNQVPYGYDERYKFTGKERDEETGYDYFGARFYWQAGTWLSVDPWADKYPQISPYAYCGWNPIKFVDPDGRYFDDTNEETAQKIEAELFTKKIYAALGNNNQMRELYSTWKDIQDMRNDGKNEYRFELDKNKPGTTSKEEDGHQIITMYSNLETLDETVAHEVRHGGQTARGEISYDNNNQKQNYDVEKEVDAYRAQWGWRGSPLQIPIDDGKHPIPVPANANYFDITNKLIKSITNGWLDKNDKLYNFK